MSHPLKPALLSACIVSASVLAEAAPPPRYVQGEVIVKFKRSASAGRMAGAARAASAQAVIARPLVDPVTGTGNPRVVLTRFPRTTSVEAMVARLRALPDVEYAEPNYIVSLADPKIHRPGERTTVTRRAGVDSNGRLLTQKVPVGDIRAMAATYPTDPGQLTQWGWTWVNADVVWPDLKSAEVAVVDTGVDVQHPELSGLVTNGYDYVNADAVANDDNGHGTHVAGIIAARSNNKVGIAGVARSKIFAVKVLDAAGFGTYFDVAQGILKAANRLSVKVINVSLGGPADSLTLRTAVEYAVLTKGKLLVAAAGNESEPGMPPVSAPFYPAAYSVDYPERVMAVAASGIWVVPSSTGNPDDSVFLEYCRADYSNYGDYVTITAPGTDIYSTQPWQKDFYNHRYFGADPDLTGYEYYSGTSMAAPHVSAVAARVAATHPAFTNVDVFRRLLFQGYSTVIGVPIDVDGDGANEIAECWETGFTPPTPLGGPPFLADVNAATALGRARVTGRLLDATTGLGLSGATATLLKGTATGKVGYGGLIAAAGTSFFDIVNVPWSDQTGVGPVAPPYRLRASKSGYGAPIIEDYNASDPQKPGITIPFFSVENSLRQVSIPPYNANYVFVTDWGTWLGGGYGTTTELDQYLFLPWQLNPPGDLGCTVGFDLLTGDCGDPGPTGSLLAYPWARWMRDGGPTDGLGTETTSIRKLLPTTFGPYELLMWDYTTATGDSGFAQPDAFPVVRLWRSGVVKATVRFETAAIDPACEPPLGAGATHCDFWRVGTLTSAGVFSPVNVVGDASLQPYASGGGGTTVGVSPRQRRAGGGSTGGGTIIGLR